MADRGTVVAPVRTSVTAVLGSWTAVSTPTADWTMTVVKPKVASTPPTLGQLWPRVNK